MDTLAIMAGSIHRNVQQTRQYYSVTCQKYERNFVASQPAANTTGPNMYVNFIIFKFQSKQRKIGKRILIVKNNYNKHVFQKKKTWNLD